MFVIPILDDIEYMSFSILLDKTDPSVNNHGKILSIVFPDGNNNVPRVPKKLPPFCDLFNGINVICL